MGKVIVMDIILKHQIAVAKKTLQMPDEIVDYLNACSGAITKDEAREILRVNGVRFDVKY